MKEEVTNLSDHRLAQLANEIHGIINTGKRSWREIGSRLSEARRLLSADQDFGRWCQAQGFGMKRNTLFLYRECYEFGVHHDEHRMPDDWNVIYKIKIMSEAQQAEVLERLKAGEVFTRAKLNKEYPKKAKGPIRRITQGDLNKQMRKLEKMEQNKEKEIQKVAQAIVQEEIGKEVARLKEKQDEAIREKKNYMRKIKGIPAILSKEEFKIIIGCLHPDRPERTAEQLRKAFSLVKKLEPLL